MLSQSNSIKKKNVKSLIYNTSIYYFYINYIILVIRILHIASIHKFEFLVRKILNVIIEHAFITLYLYFILFLSFCVHFTLDYIYNKKHKSKRV